MTIKKQLICGLILTLYTLYTKTITDSAQTQAKKILITNNITQKDTGKTKFFIRHYPEKFDITVNGIQLKSNETKEISICDHHFNVEYSYVWSAPWGKITGTKQVTYEIYEKNIEKIELNFTSWDDEYRINASNTKPINVKVIESSGAREKKQKRKKQSMQKKYINPTAQKLQVSNQTSIPYNKKKLCVN